MARQSDGPWFRKAKNSWYATFEGRKVALGVRGGGNRAAAQTAWHRLMGGLSAGRVEPKPKPARKPPTQSVPAPTLTVAGLVSAYLADAKERVSERSYVGYAHFLTLFASAFPDRSAESVKPYEAEASSRRPNWSATYRANYLNMAVMSYRWAVRAGLLASNALAGVRKPTRSSRGASAVVADDEYQQLLAHARPDTADLLAVLWGTGARPGEVTGLTAEMVRASADGVIPLSAHKTAHKGKARTLILTGEAWAIVQRRAEAAGSGLLFPNAKGRRLTTQALQHRIKKLCRRAGVRHLIGYGFRHGYATQALAAGIPDATVAALLGHGSTQMLHRHYSHLTSRTDVLRQAAARVR